MNPHRGFTLLELLIGLTLLGFILALLFGGFRLASSSWDAVATHAERTTDEQMAREFLRRILTQLQPLRWKKAQNQPVSFVGQRELLRGVAPISGQAGGGLRVVELALEQDGQDGGRRRLVLRQAPLRYDAELFDDALAEAKTHQLLDDLDAVEFNYFGPPKEGEPSSWQDTWTDTAHLPRLVRLRLGSRQPEWADVVATPMIGSTGCIWDSVNRQCR
jgi:general secretion pathway protein J